MSEKLYLRALGEPRVCKFLPNPSSNKKKKPISIKFFLWVFASSVSRATQGQESFHIFNVRINAVSPHIHHRIE